MPGEVADLPSRLHVVLFGEQSEIVGASEQPLEQCAGLVDPAVERQCTHQPERAGQELAFVSRKPVVGVRRGIPGHEAVATEFVPDRVDRGGDPVVGGRKPTSGMSSTLASSSAEP